MRSRRVIGAAGGDACRDAFGYARNATSWRASNRTPHGRPSRRATATRMRTFIGAWRRSDGADATAIPPPRRQSPTSCSHDCNSATSCSMRRRRSTPAEPAGAKCSFVRRGEKRRFAHRRATQWRDRSYGSSTRRRRHSPGRSSASTRSDACYLVVYAGDRKADFVNDFDRTPDRAMELDLVDLAHRQKSSARSASTSRGNGGRGRSRLRLVVDAVVESH